MKNHKYLLAAILFLFTLGIAGVAAAQSSPQKDEGGARIQGKAGDNNFDIKVQGGESRRDAAPAREGDRGARSRRLSRRPRPGRSARTTWTSRPGGSVRRQQRSRHGRQRSTYGWVRSAGRSHCCDRCRIAQ
jgi:hypothetical protein